MRDERDASQGTEQPNPHPTASRPTLGPCFSLRSLMIGVLVMCVVLAVLLPLIRGTRVPSAWQVTCANNLKQIGLALHNYHDVHRMFPPAVTYSADGVPMHSWRVLLMPYVEGNFFYDRYVMHEPWNGGSNGLLADATPNTWPRDTQGGTRTEVYMPACYRCPSASASQDRRSTNYVTLIDDRPGKPNGLPNRPGSAPANSTRSRRS
ncbi:MAG: DUF1559 family PulG-like putative transporter [Pirellulaceae bacterium]